MQHDRFGATTLDLRPLIALASGNTTALNAALLAASTSDPVGDSVDAAIAKAQRARFAHGAMMIAAFALLMPLGVLLARHKWVFGDPEAGKISPMWFHLHRYIQGLAILVAVASIVLVFAQFGRGRGSVSELYKPHMGLGVAAVAASVVQIGIAAVR